MKLAVITGGTSGIGRTFAFALARQGLNVWIVGRRSADLTKTAQEIEQQFAVSCRPIVCDLSVESELDQLITMMRSETGIEFLINNAGYADDGAFHAMQMDQHRAQMDVHMLAPTKLTHAVLPVMLANKHGSIINVSSVASFMPTPSSPLYGPTKAYLRSFTESLALAYAHTPIRFQALSPGFTVTDFHTRMGLRPEDVYRNKGLFRSYGSKEVVEQSLRDLDRGRVVSIYGFNYRFLVGLMRRLPFTWLYGLLRRQTALPRYKFSNSAHSPEKHTVNG